MKYEWQPLAPTPNDHHLPVSILTFLHQNFSDIRYHVKLQSRNSTNGILSIRALTSSSSLNLNPLSKQVQTN